MKILLINREKDVPVVLTRLLIKMKYQIFPVLEKNIHPVNYKGISLIIIYNNILSQKKIKFIEKLQIPMILIIEEFEIFKSYIRYPHHYDKIIILKDGIHRTINYIPLSRSFILPYLFILENTIKPKQESTRKQLLISFNSMFSDEIIIRLTPVLNRLFRFDIKIVNQQKALPKVFNKNCLVIKKENFEKELELADIVIANKHYALKAIVAQKPVIVVGDHGLGGFITPQVIKTQYHSCFSGRIGGEIDEYIPAKLLLDDILTINEMEQTEKQQIIKGNMDFLAEQEGVLISAIDQLISKVVQNYVNMRDKLLSCKLKIADDYKLLPVDNDNHFFLHTPTDYSNIIIGKECFDIISGFNGKKEAISIWKEKASDYSKEDFKDFILDLLKENILEIAE